MLMILMPFWASPRIILPQQFPQPGNLQQLPEAPNLKAAKEMKFCRGKERETTQKSLFIVIIDLAL
jgi:hypothetical protein